MKMAFRGLPLLVVARAAARRAQALEANRSAAVPAEASIGAPGAPRPDIEPLRRYVRR